MGIASRIRDAYDMTHKGWSQDAKTAEEVEARVRPGVLHRTDGTVVFHGGKAKDSGIPETEDR